MSTYSGTASGSSGGNLNSLRSRPLAASFILIGGIIALVIGIGVSVSFGAANISFTTVWEAVLRYNPDLPQHQIIQEIRLPRVLGGAMVGASFAVAGALMQGMTRNPMADSGLLGLNAGACFMLAVCMAFLPNLPYMYTILYCFAGAALGALLVLGISALGRGGLSPLRLVLAGAAVSALLVALAEGVALYFHIGQELAFWYAGGISTTKWFQLKIMFPWVGGAIIGAMLLARSVTLLSLGDDVAMGLGQRTGLVKLLGMIIVLILAGCAVSVVGAVGFVGLIIPHVTRFLVGVDYRWIIPCSAILGSLLMVAADLAARMINPPYETPVGALIALIGVPFFLFLTSKDQRGMA